MTQSIIERVRAAGVIGGGGAGFPTHVKLDARTDTVLVNGASCEPLLCSDIHLLETRAPVVADGLCAAMAATGAQTGLICIKAKHKRAVDEAKKTAAGRPGVSVFEIKDFYPAGDEHVLVNEALGRIVPQGGIPLDVGAVVSNVESLYNVARAQTERPVTHRTLNVAGEVRRPVVVRVPVGMPVSQVLDLAGGLCQPGCRIIDGGPMMGRVLDDPDQAFVTKTTSGIIALPRDHNVVTGKTADPQQLRRLTRTVCCQCSLCTQMCPRNQLGHNLHPHLIMRSLGTRAPVQEEALICSECGICEKWACPMHLSPREVNAALKKEAAGTARDLPGGSLSRHPFTDFRRIPSKRLMGRLNILKYDKPPEVHEGPVAARRAGYYLNRHIGAPSQPVVREGDRVDAGQLLAEIPQGKLGARVHAGISGQVAKIDSQTIFLVKE